MALGKRTPQQQEMWIATADLPRSPGHVFYRKLNELLSEVNFDQEVKSLCKPFYAERRGRPSIPPGVYFRMLLIGFFEGIGSQRGIAWRCSDSLSLREFLGLGPTDSSPDHSSLTRVRDRLPLEVHQQVFLLVLQLAGLKKLFKGTTIGVDAMTLEANAAMKSIVRKDTGEDWDDYLKRLMKEEEGNDDPTDEDLRRFDKKRTGKKVSNEEWESLVVKKLADHQLPALFEFSSVADVSRIGFEPNGSFRSESPISKLAPYGSSFTYSAAAIQCPSKFGEDRNAHDWLQRSTWPKSASLAQERSLA